LKRSGISLLLKELYTLRGVTVNTFSHHLTARQNSLCLMALTVCDAHHGP